MARAGDGLLLRAYNRFRAGDLTGLQRVFWCWPIRWPRQWREKRVAGRFWGFLGLWCWRAMLASAGQGAACLFSLYACTVLDKPTVCVWSSLMLKPRLWQGLGVWPSVWLRAML